eukprot:9474264-Pyramimonas_sp.AAC.2
MLSAWRATRCASTRPASVPLGDTHTVNTGMQGLYFATRRAVYPVVDRTMIAFAWTFCAARTAEEARDSLTLMGTGTCFRTLWKAAL